MPIIPLSPPTTYSFLFMPLIYAALYPPHVLFPPSFPNKITESVHFLNSMGITPPFHTPETLFDYLKTHLCSNGITQLAHLNRMLDSDHHIPGPLQEKITNYHTDPLMIPFVYILGYLLIRDCKGEDIQYSV